MAYKYITDNNLYEKQNYMYSEYGGKDFINEYLESRQTYVKKQMERSEFDEEIPLMEALHKPNNLVRQNLQEMLTQLKAGDTNGSCRQIMNCVNAYTKSFEVRKRLYTGYDDNWKPLEGAGFEDYTSYLLFADCLLQGYRHTGCLKYFSCLLKVNDTLLSVQNQLDEQSKTLFCQIIRQELNIFYQLAREKGIDVEVAK